MPIGKEKLRTMVRDTCAEAGITEKKTNHSGASYIFSASVPEKLIQSRTGHRSLEALILNEKPSHEQHQATSNILTSGAQAREFGKELTNVTASNVQPISSIVDRNIAISLNLQLEEDSLLYLLFLAPCLAV